MDFPQESLDVFTAWLRTGDAPEPLALIAAAMAIGQWVVSQIGDDDEPPLRGAPKMTKASLADALESEAEVQEGGQPTFRGAFPWLFLIQMIAEALLAAAKKV